MNKPAVLEITDAIPSELMCARLGVSAHSVRGARTSGVFPASWYAVLSDICAEVGVGCPRDAFNWKSNADFDSRDSAKQEDAA